MAVDVVWGVVTHSGMARSVNQDSVVAGPRLFVVADGMGGHAAGDVASAIVVARLAALDARQGVEPAGLVDAIHAVNGELLAVAAGDPSRHGMGTTLAGVALPSDGAARVLVFNVGDSRVYRCSAGCLTQLTVDHSVVGELVRSGAIRPDEALGHPDRHVVTRAVGAGAEVDVDLVAVDPQLGDRLLVCSDGLTNEVTDREIERVLSGGGTPQEAADTLLRLALAAGGRDNISAVVVEVTGFSARTPDDTDTNPRQHGVPAQADGAVDTEPRVPPLGLDADGPG